MEREQLKKLKERTSGITLVALVVTIVVLVILATVSLNAVLGEKGIINTTQKGRVEQSHQLVWEAMGMEYSTYYAEKIEQKSTMTENFVEYLQGKQLISTNMIDEGYVINVEKLVGGKSSLGNGTDGRNDVYKLEKVNSATAKTTKLASREGNIKLADEDSDGDKYRVKYYGESGERELGVLTDRIETSEPEVENEEMHKLKVGDYVQLPYNNETLECMVIYDDEYNEEKGTDYGIQMITTDTVGDGVTLGYDVDLDADIDDTEMEKQIRIAEEKYNNAIVTLNEEAGKYVNESNNKYVKSARCVGSVPDNPDEESEDYEEFYTEDGNNQIKIKGTDSNYQSDVYHILEIKNKDKELYIAFSEESYWLASRDGINASMEFYRGLVVANPFIYKEDGLEMEDIEVERFIGGMSDNNSSFASLQSVTHKIRPVFTVNTKSQSKLYGSGTQTDPYRWTEDVK